MYEIVQHRSKSSRMWGMLTAVGLTATIGVALATAHYYVDEIQTTRTELVLIKPPEPPPPPPPEEKKKPVVEVVKETPAPPPLVVPDIVVEIPEPVIVAPVSPPVPIPEPIPVVPAPAPSAAIGAVSPKLMAGDKPDYPAASVRAGEQGTTHLEVCVSAAGRATSVSVVGSSGSARLDDAAARWLRNERFKPGTVGGQAQSVCGHDVYYEWNLKDAR